MDFESPDEPEDDRSFDNAPVASGDSDSSFDLNIGDSAAARDDVGPSREILSSEDLGDEMGQVAVAPEETEEMSLGEPLEKSPPMEILVGSPTETARAYSEDDNTNAIYLAPVGRRFVAGLTDALVLILGAAVFGIIFWRFCGRLSLVPLNIAVLGLVAIILIFGYFAAFTALASSTPGLLVMGCEIRNLDGDYPTQAESLWRAFGVLVSLSALMLGFVWACVDSDSLTWHDRMSGTVVTMVHSAAVSLA
ncbi:MAG: RDD family protein [Terriglobia bacterium]